MFLIFRLIYDLYFYIFNELADPRTKGKFFADHPCVTFSIIFLYLKFVLQWGPELMKSRSAFKLKRVLVIYNIVQIMWSAHLFYLGSTHAYIFGPYNYLCEPVDTSNTDEALLVLNGTYSYFCLKMFDFLDTIFFVLRKKSKQISFLHVYHHAGMCTIAWVGAKFLPGGHMVFLGFINSFVHMVMYFYYLMAILYGSERTFWWKKHITQLQIFQFFIVALHLLALCIHPYCGYPRIIGFCLLPQNVFMTLMFVDFYYKTYIKPKRNTVISNNVNNTVSAK